MKTLGSLYGKARRETSLQNLHKTTSLKNPKTNEVTNFRLHVQMLPSSGAVNVKIPAVVVPDDKVELSRLSEPEDIL